MNIPEPDEGVPVAVAFLPLHKRAFGLAIGIAAALITFLATAVYLLRDPHPGLDLALLSQYFAGYSVSWKGPSSEPAGPRSPAS